MRLIVLSAAALVGLALGEVGVGRLDPRALLVGSLLALLGACLAGRRPTARWVALSTCAVAAGALRAALVEVAPPATLAPYEGQVVRLAGTLLEPPGLSSSGVSVRLLLEVHAIGPPGHDPPLVAAARLRVIGDPAALGQTEAAAEPRPPSEAAARSRQSGEAAAELRSPGDAAAGAPLWAGALATGQRAPGDAAAGAPLWAGDEVVLEGRLLAGDSRGPPSLLVRQLLDSRPSPAPSPLAWLSNVRAMAAAGIRRYLPEPQGSLAVGLLLGGSGQLDVDFRAQLQRSGLAHLVAIDGYKQVIVAGALGALGVRLLGVRLATLPIVLGVAGYTLLTGAHPAAVRAALMVGLASLASATGRVADPLTSLLLALLAMAALDPAILLDVGLQLSLSATLGIILLWPRLRRRLRGLPDFVAEPAGLTMAVTLATLPVMLSVFQSISLVSPLAHILAVPLLPLALVSTAALAAVSAVAPVASVVAWLAWLPNTLLVEVIRAAGSLPGAALSTGRLPTPAAFGLSAGLLAWGLWGLPEAAGLRQRWARLRLAERRWSVPAASLCACIAALGALQLVRPDGRLHVQALSAGRGEAVFIRGPTGRTALVVGGRVDAATLAGQVATNLAVWEHQLDDVLCLDAAAETGLGLTLARYPAQQLVRGTQDQLVDLGGGAVLAVYAQAPRAAVTFGQLTLVVPGQPPPAAIVSDGTDTWTTAER